MRFATTFVAATTLLVCTARGSAQTGVTPNVNRLSTGNANTNSNSQFLSGSNTGVNNGSMDVYAGADPYQGIVIEGSANLPQLPGLMQPPSNFSQPYKPETFVNGPAFLPAEMTLSEANSCRDSKASWHGGSQEKVTSIRLFYTTKQQSPDVPLTMANYVGTAMATASDRPFIAALCEAAYKAMTHGASVGVVEFGVRPKNTMFGIGFGASGGATGLPAAGANPYAIAGTLGFGTGWSSQRVEGEVVLQLTALRAGSRSSATDSDAVSSPSKPATPDSDRAPDRDASKAVNRGASIAGSIQLTAFQDAEGGRGKGTAMSRPRRHATMHHSAKKLVTIRTGQSKDRVFDVFSTIFVEQDAKIIEVEGMRLAVSARSGRNTRLEVSEVTLDGPDATGTPYWFLFEDGRLIAWGSPDQWDDAVTRYRLNIPYRAAAPASSLTTIAGVRGGR